MLDGVRGVNGEQVMADADWLFHFAAPRREFRGWGIANGADNAGGAACARLVRLDLHPSKLGSLHQLPFPNMERADKITNWQSPCLPMQDGLNALETFAAEGLRCIHLCPSHIFLGSIAIAGFTSGLLAGTNTTLHENSALGYRAALRDFEYLSKLFA